MSHYFSLTRGQIKNISKVLTPGNKTLKPIMLPSIGKPVSHVLLSDGQTSKVLNSPGRASVVLSKNQVKQAVQDYERIKQHRLQCEHMK